jgi:hypothetical protein
MPRESDVLSDNRAGLTFLFRIRNTLNLDLANFDIGCTTCGMSHRWLTQAMPNITELATGKESFFQPARLAWYSASSSQAG